MTAPGRVVAQSLLLVAVLLVTLSPGHGADPDTEPAVTTVGNPNWSPDGEWIAFTGDRHGAPGIYLMRPDGSDARRIPIVNLQPRWPSWSADGRWIAFAADPAGEGDSLDLYVVRPDGAGLRRVTHGAVYGGLVGWSADSERLAFYSPNDDRWDIFTIRVDGSGLTQVTDGSAQHFIPSWSPDGTLLLMGADRDGNDDIWVRSETDGTMTPLTRTPYRESAPRWSPDGNWISFEADADGDWEIFVMRADGSHLRQLTKNESFDAMTTWAPDGHRLAYECRQGDEQHICIIDLQDTAPRIITSLEDSELPCSLCPYVVVLGVAQDGGSPQAGSKNHPGWDDPAFRHRVASLGLVDPPSGGRWMFDATPDFREQLHHLDQIAPVAGVPGLAGIFLTHAHIGHYTGLMFLGHESIGAHGVPVYTMPLMEKYLSGNGPWDQLVRYGNIVLKGMQDGVAVRLNDRLAVTPIIVPHRQEYSEVVGYRIEGPGRSVLFIPDIDSWKEWDAAGTRIEQLIAPVDVAYLDGSFYSDGEIPGRDMSGFPHPFITRSMQRFAPLAAAEKKKIRFIHLNHTNPALRPDSEARRSISANGFRVADEGETIDLGATP